MADPRYICWADHKEDLTDKVEAARKESVPVVALQEDKQQRLTIVCSEGHTNIFEV
jgi:anti-sigma regulatory factor (Ser/Thr protein kinase)